MSLRAEEGDGECARVCSMARGFASIATADGHLPSASQTMPAPQ
jgi:hypothetical protein